MYTVTHFRKFVVVTVNCICDLFNWPRLEYFGVWSLSTLGILYKTILTSVGNQMIQHSTLTLICVFKLFAFVWKCNLFRLFLPHRRNMT